MRQITEINMTTGVKTTRNYTADEEATADASQLIDQTATTDPNNYTLTMRQLRLALLTFGSKPVDFVASVVDNISDPTQRAQATIWYEETTDGISWSHPETQFLIAASGLTTDQAKILWLKAKDL